MRHCGRGVIVVLARKGKGTVPIVQLHWRTIQVRTRVVEIRFRQIKTCTSTMQLLISTYWDYDRSSTISN
jgi:hypothetical protein